MSGEPLPIRVLLVEDSPDDAELVIIHLRRAGYQPAWRRVESGAALREALGEGAWDIILADYSMPQFNVLNALSIVKESGIDIPFIIVSGSVGEAAAVEAMKAGAHDFFLKDKLTRLAAAVERERREADVRRERRQAIKELQENQERLREAVVARDEFLSIASHELKTPLTSLSLHVESARRLLNDAAVMPIPDGKLENKLAIVSRQVSRLTTLINNLLDVTRIASGRMELAPEAVDLRDAVEAVTAGLHEQLTRSGSTLDLKAEAPVLGQWDRLRIESAIFNLVSNAIRYGAGKPISVVLEERVEAAWLVVTDHGIGIASKEQERIFRRFERALPEKHFGGFGLGLWVAREIIEAHGGTIAVKSAPGAGSAFTVQLPLARQDRA